MTIYEVIQNELQELLPKFKVTCAADELENMLVKYISKLYPNLPTETLKIVFTETLASNKT